MLDVGIIGAGNMGSGHARYLGRGVPGARVAVVHDVDASRAKALAAEIGTEVATDPFDLIGGDLDGVIIASPDPTHPDLAIACIEAGIPALVEKPLASQLSEAKRVLGTPGSDLLSLGFMRRFDPQHVALRDRLLSGALGDARLFRGIHRNANPPPNATTRLVVTGSAIHDIDTARWLLGPFESVAATARSSSGTDVADLVLIEGHHDGGAVSTIEVFVAAGYGYEVIAEVVGTAGVATTLRGDLIEDRHAGSTGSGVPSSWLHRFETAYVDELRAWTDSIATGSPFSGASAEDAYADQVVAEAVLASIASGTRIEIEEVG